MPLAGGAPGHPLSAAIAPAQCRWILGAPVQSLRIRLCAGGAAADRLRAGAPDSHGALARRRWFAARHGVVEEMLAQHSGSYTRAVAS